MSLPAALNEMPVGWDQIRIGLLMAAAAGCWGCDARSQPATRPATMGSPAAAPDWSREEAVARLDDEHDGVRAAVRLVRLAGLAPLCVPDELSEAQTSRLRLLRLRDDCWALGLPDRRDARCLHAALLISATGEVTPLAEGVEEEWLTLHVSRDADVFPHLAICPQKVLLVAADVTPAVVLAPGQHVRFALRTERRFSYVALLAPTSTGEAEVARFRWDPYEMTFTGPASDKLPDPPGGRFQIDLKASRRLEPVGGELPEPEENKPPPRRPHEPAPNADELQAA